jgi:SAM-dependent methyltransferase
MDINKLKQWAYDPDQFDNDTVFRQMIYDAVGSESRVLDAGAGAGELFQYELKDKAMEIVGVDLDPRVERNPQLHRGICANLTNIPVEDNYFDLVFSRYVLEHIDNPQEFLQEIYRILKPGGCFLFLAPNRWHYVSIIASFTPMWFHNWYNRLRGRQEDDTFPTVYHLNTRSRIRRQFRFAGFEERKLIFRECCPNYLTFSIPTFLLGVVYERLVNCSDLLSTLRVNVLGVFYKTDRKMI